MPAGRRVRGQPLSPWFFRTPLFPPGPYRRCKVTKTVGNYVCNIFFVKLQVADRAGPIIRACEAGMG